MRLPAPTRHIGAALAILLAAGACTPVRSHQGYVVDADLVNSVQPGVDNRQSVLATLGKPSFASQFAPNQSNGGDWYYVARDSRNLAFRNPRAKAQITIQISFDQKGDVATPSLSVYQVKGKGFELVKTVSK